MFVYLQNQTVNKNIIMQNSTVTPKRGYRNYVKYLIGNVAGAMVPPPTSNNNVLVDTNSDNDGNPDDVLKPFDYDAFLKREGLV
jgi:hypothetical protein